MRVKVTPTSLNQAISAVGSLETLPSRTTLPLASMTQMHESSKDAFAEMDAVRIFREGIPVAERKY
jgi:hypothetical protein